jgi:hypothetical protein
MGNLIPFPNRPRGRILANPKLKFLDQCREGGRVKGFASRDFSRKALRATRS